MSDAGLVHFKKLKNLDFLSLRWTAVTDAGLVHLKSLKRLLYLDVRGTSVTPEGVADLKLVLLPKFSVAF